MRRMPDAWGGNAPVPVRKGQGSLHGPGAFLWRRAGRLRFHAGNCPAFYWLLMCIFENIPLL